MVIQCHLCNYCWFLTSTFPDKSSLPLHSYYHPPTSPMDNENTPSFYWNTFSGSKFSDIWVYSFNFPLTLFQYWDNFFVVLIIILFLSVFFYEDTYFYILQSFPFFIICEKLFTTLSRTYTAVLSLSIFRFTEGIICCVYLLLIIFLSYVINL